MCEIDWFMCEIDWFMCDISGTYRENGANNYLREISESRWRSYRASAKCVYVSHTECTGLSLCTVCNH